jgi:response regulator NasT
MQQARILIADDDAMVRLDLRSMLEAAGHCVVAEADNGKSACVLARKLRPDVVLLDVMMPGGNGIEAAEAIGKERLAAVVMLTAYSDVPIVEKANKAGVLGYLVKPFRQQALEPAIAVAMSRYRELLALEGALDSAHDSIEASRLVGRAKRVLMERFGVNEQEAHRRMSAQALNTGRPLRDIAEAILLTAETAAPVETRPRRGS